MPLLLEPKDGETILKTLERDRILDVTRSGDMFEFSECCDYYYTRILSKDQVLSLIKELTDMVTNPVDIQGQPIDNSKT
jgi:hypothetical protein